MPETPAEPPRPRELRRARDDRVLGGVCAGVGRYLGIDATIIRIATVVLACFGGAGVLLYLAALLLVPEEGPDATMHRGRALTVAGIVLLVVAAGALLPHGPWFSWPFGLALAAGLAAWLVVVARRAGGDGREVARRVLRAALIALAGAVLALGGALLAGTGHATLAAIAVVCVGAALVGLGLLGRGGGELVLPALALALGVALVSAAGIDLRGGLGDRLERPGSVAAIRDVYRLGAGRLVVDLRAAHLPPGERRIRVRMGLGEAVLLVPRGVCVSTRAKIGGGEAVSFTRVSGGVDVDWRDEPAAPAGRPRVLLDADVGLGRVAVAHSLAAAERFARHVQETVEGPPTGDCVQDYAAAR